jgi:predicted nucleic acid-binding protein
MKFDAPATVIEEIVALLRIGEIVPAPRQRPPIAVRDPDDILVWAAALQAKVDVLVTGDKDLLAVKDQAGIVITTPRGFWEWLKRKNS